MSHGDQVICGNCGRTNGLPVDRRVGGARCGSCHQPGGREISRRAQERCMQGGSWPGRELDSPDPDDLNCDRGACHEHRQSGSHLRGICRPARPRAGLLGQSTLVPAAGPCRVQHGSGVVHRILPGGDRFQEARLAQRQSSPVAEACGPRKRSPSSGASICPSLLIYRNVRGVTSAIMK